MAKRLKKKDEQNKPLPTLLSSVPHYVRPSERSVTRETKDGRDDINHKVKRDERLLRGLMSSRPSLLSLRYTREARKRRESDTA